MYCSSYSSYFYTPEFLQLALHIISIISIPCHILAFYCVIFKTPKTMESVKITMIVLCVWTVIMDLQITLLSVPFVMFPAIAGFPFGYLNYMGVGTLFQCFLTGSSLVGCTTALSCLFANRYSRITMKDSKYQQISIYGFNFSIAFIVALIGFLDIPDQLPALQLLYENLPCISSDVRSHPVFVFSLNATRMGLCIAFLISCILLEYLYFLVITTYHLKIQSNSNVSSRTRNLQQAIFFSVALQILIPVFIIFLPWIYAIYSVFFDYYNQAFNNILALNCGLHGIVSSISMILIHKPYRRAIFQVKLEESDIRDGTTFWRAKIFRKTNLIHGRSTNINYVS